MSVFDFTQLDRIINARSMAIVGASGLPMKFGTFFTGVQLSVGFRGTIYLVNPHEKEIIGHTTFPDLPSLPQVPDLVYLTIPAHRSMEVLRDCADMKVKAVIILAAGFREIGEEGKALEDEALSLAERGGFRIIGPNCFGIYNPRNGLTLLPGRDFSNTPGDIAFISQSGGFAAHVARLGKSLGIDFSAVVSYGNAADLNETDFLRYFAMDPQTRVIAGYIEGARGEDFADAIRSTASAKPVVLWKVGRSEASRRAVVSHTGSLSGSAELWEALMRQSGVITASGVEEVCDVLLALKHFGRNPGRRLLISGGGGGLGTYAADLAEDEGLEVPALDGETLERMKTVLGRPGAVAGNPLDIGAPLIPLQEFEPAMLGAAANRSTDILIFDMAVNFAYDLAGEPGLELATDVLIHTRSGSEKPMAAVLYSRACDPDNLTVEQNLRRMRARLLDAGIPVYPSMPRALRAISRVNS